MNILMLSGETLSDHHGGAIHTKEVARAFSELGHQVFLVAPGSWAGSPIRHRSCDMTLGPITSTWKSFHLYDEVVTFSPDVIYERQLISGGVGSYFSQQLEVPLVYEVNSPHLDEYLVRFPFLNLFEKILRQWESKQFSHCDLLVGTHECMVPSHYEGQSFIGPWAVRIDEIDQYDKLLWDGLSKKKIILVAGSFQAWHGLDHIEQVARAFFRGHERSKNNVFVLVGSSNRLNLLKRLSDLGDCIQDGGELSQKEMMKAYKESNILLAPFDKPLPDKPFYYSPFKILEALGSGLPIVTDDYENIRKLMSQKWCGHLIEKRDVNKWVEAIDLCLNQPRASQEDVNLWTEKFSWKRHVSEILRRVL